VNYEGRRFGVPYWYTRKTCRIQRKDYQITIYDDELNRILTTHDVTWSRRDRFCRDQYAITQPEELVVLEEPFGELEHKEGYLDDRGLIERGGSLVTAFVNAYYKETKERVVAVSASRGSAQISSFNNYLVEDVIERLENAKQTMMEQQVNIRHIYMVWFQGETDAYLETPKEQYIGGMQKLLNTLQPYGVERCFVIQIGNVMMEGKKVETRGMHEIQETLCETDENFVLVSTLPKELSEPPYMEDGIHFTQKGLNAIGEDAGKQAGSYVKSVTEGR
jgi:hypothetical protein